MKIISALVALAFLAVTPAFAEETRTSATSGAAPDASGAAAKATDPAAPVNKEERKLEKKGDKKSDKKAVQGETPEKLEKVEKMNDRK